MHKEFGLRIRDEFELEVEICLIVIGSSMLKVDVGVIVIDGGG